MYQWKSTEPFPWHRGPGLPLYSPFFSLMKFFTIKRKKKGKNVTWAMTVVVELVAELGVPGHIHPCFGSPFTGTESHLKRQLFKE